MNILLSLMNCLFTDDKLLDMKNLIHTKIALVIFMISAVVWQACQAQDNSTQKAILVTGATSGIGLKITEVLSAKGYFVYAGARKQADIDRLNAMDNVQAVKLDVTKWDEINAAVEAVKREGRGLYGLINNAGVAVVAPLIELDEKDLDFQFDVNVYGPYRVTKAFAPLIMESKGRIITTGSISGIMTWPLGGPYCMSKHAVEAFTDALALEMAQFDVQVSVVEPGNYNSKISKSFADRLRAGNPDFENSLFKERMESLASNSGDRSQFKEPDEVAAAVEHALFSENPKRRYMVVPNEREGEMTMKAAIREMVQLNQDQPYSYDREKLIELLDEALNEVGGSE